MIENLRTVSMNLPAMNLPGSRLPALGGKALISAAIVASLAMIVIVRASSISPATSRSAHLTSASSTNCDQHVWPYVTSSCLQGTPDNGEPVRIVTPKPPPDAQTQAREADARYNAAMQTKPPKREHYGDVTRERRARRNATFF